ncbi:baseplate J/gp47 family protein [Chitinophaga sp. sic0106]|uniref:baseplate J/gp47 family protein n=1 Tax=Chitinophaga sp. sic0106 TaxID=2854785 RepID=UPI001C4402C9|nr:baseplate J/gp47 family protein [Chitinophaga sp. sic0106]MBV7530225.1 baseplate J/gp47 family protein [Chitinophaga sp. sic0106]
MSSNNSYKNPLLHSGTSRYNRVLAALEPSFARVDERSMSDLILFAKAYSQQLNFFNAANEQDGNWLPLMQMDVSVILATLANQDISGYRQLLRQQLQYLADKRNEKATDLVQRFSFLFDFTWSWLYELDTQLRLLPDQWPFKSWLTNVIGNTLSTQRHKLNAWYQQASLMGCVTDQYDQTAYLPVTRPVPFRIDAAGSLRVQKWETAWSLGTSGTGFHLQGTAVADRIRFAATNNLFTGIFDAIFKQASLITQHAAKNLEAAVTDFPAHTPHYTLFLTFLKLFRFAQEELNTFTGRHLDFYYKDVLQLTPAPATPDATNLVIELQKNTKDYLLEAGTLFKGGKDAAGNVQLYATDKDVLITQATVADIRGITALPKEHPEAGIYASTVANSMDGLGTPLAAGDSWQPFGVVSKDTRSFTGCAIASPLLLMKEGERKAVITFKSRGNFPQHEGVYDLDAQMQFTGPTGWINASGEFWADESWQTPVYHFGYGAGLSAAQDAVVPYNPAIHGGNYTTAFPILRFRFKALSAQAALLLEQWENTILSEVDIDITVKGIRQLNIYSEAGRLDISKPFQPFGFAPHVGSACTIGNDEIFIKPNAEVKLNITWDNVPQPEGIVNHTGRWKTVESKVDNRTITITEPNTAEYDETDFMNEAGDPATNTPFAYIEVLKNGKWQFVNNGALFCPREYFGNTLMDKLRGKITDPDFLDTYPAATNDLIYPSSLGFISETLLSPTFDKPSQYDAGAKNGFARIILQKDLGHKDYQRRFAYQAGKQRLLPLEPYTPTAQTITADYTATQTLKVGLQGELPGAFYSLHSFGEREEANSWRMLPPVEAAGQLYIGLDKVIPGTAIPVLFRISEGSANPLVASQPVRWQWLSNTGYWEEFSNVAVQDDTNGLLRGGIITFNLPANIATNPAMMGGKYCWIRAMVNTNPDAISKLISLSTQAVRVHWANNGTSVPYTIAAPAGTIQRMITPASAIKKITQPATSTGGKREESAAQFRMRVSERLRHKSRAVTIWDYEHLVLEKFHEIFRVKCLNHTTASATNTSEMAPGNVLIIPIPDMSRIPASNPQRPLTSVDTLASIESYLKELAGSFVNIKVCNPVFEEVVISCEVQYKDGNTAANTLRLLKDFRAFLSPWIYDTSVQPEFGGKISKSTLVNMLEGLPYVEFILHLKLFLRKDDHIILKDVEEITTSSARSMLVCAPDDVHTITPVNI